ncbi:MAG: hypothetical protein KDD51_11855, partial [Bdellovibrionales bacterium]|nr:hypothetical protein [Bdellovibrionales bacterium]
MRDSWTKIMALGLLLVLLGQRHAFADDTPVNWNVGRVYVEGAHIVVRFGDGEIIRFSNLRVYNPASLDLYRETRRRLIDERRQALAAAHEAAVPGEVEAGAPVRLRRAGDVEVSVDVSEVLAAIAAAGTNGQGNGDIHAGGR